MTTKISQRQPLARQSNLLDYETTAQKDFDWALQKLLESQQRRRKAQSASEQVSLGRQTGRMMPYLCYDPQVKKTRRLRKIVDETTQVRCALGKGLIREELWQDSRGAVAKYNLAFINHALCARDNGRVVGYDNSHGDHHRHFAGANEKFTFISYERLLERFLDEVRELRQKKETI